MLILHCTENVVLFFTVFDNLSAGRNILSPGRNTFKLFCVYVHLKNCMFFILRPNKCI